MLPGLALAGANPRDGDDGDDGILTAAEAPHLPLGGCDLVVLSARDTAGGTPESGEGVLGLVRGFPLAGARRVLGSFWRVDDEATRLLLTAFYDALRGGSAPAPSPAEALRQAARRLRAPTAAGARPYAAPRFWAAFVAYGR